MENIQLLMHGFSTLFTFSNVGAALLGAVLGLVVGAMPGIGSLAGVALLLPLTYKFNPTTAIIMLGALYYSNMYTFTHWNTYIVPNRGAKSKPTAPKSAAGHKVFTNAVSFVVCGAGTVQISFTKPAQGADFTDSVSVGHGGRGWPGCAGSCGYF